MSDIATDPARLAEANRATVLRLMAALDQCDSATIREIIAADAPWWVLGVGEIDRETLISQLEQMLGSARVAETHILGTTAEGERVAVESKGNFEFEDGRTYRNSYHHLFLVRDGKVVGVREYLDLRVTEATFGPLPGKAG
jgi:ketosteroid isomerase-like protein